MNYELNGEVKELNFRKESEDINYRSRIVDIAANSYVKDGCPALLEKNNFIITYYVSMTDIDSNVDSVILEVASKIDEVDLPYFIEMYGAYLKRVQFLLSDQSIRNKVYETLSKLNNLVSNYSEPKNVDKLLKTVIKEFAKLDSEKLKAVSPYIDSILPIISKSLADKK